MYKRQEKALARIEAMGMGHLPVCMAKNQYSLSDDPKKLGRPTGFTVNIREVYVSAGAGFVVAITGTIMTMPGLPKVPAAEAIDAVSYTHLQLSLWKALLCKISLPSTARSFYRAVFSNNRNRHCQ